MSLNKILVATNLTERSDRALARALQLKPDALVLLHVVSAGLPPEVAAEQQKAAEAFLAHRLRYETSEGASDRSHTVLTGSAFSTIIAEAISDAAELIIIGKPGTHPFSELFVGTTAERVIRFSDRPVLMVKQAESGSYRRVLVAFDGSEGAVRALQMAVAIAPDAEFRVVHAWWAPHVPLGDLEAARQAIHQENERIKMLIANAARQAVAKCGGSPKVVIDLVEGNPYIVIANQSSWADLLAMGTHSKGFLASTVSIGKLARHLLIEASCDVLTSRP
jgi:nucleotide-binding universal stress UspA family protein